MILENGQGPPVKLVVNAAPVLDERGGRRGILVTFDNVTELEEKNLELNQTVRQLQVVTAEVQSKNRELEFLASHDPLTQLLNRRALNEGLEREFSEARRQGRELSCIMCDIDHFKWVNDNRGHAAGDQVITRVAALLQQNSRESDLVGRWGGEEFCILLPGLDIGQAAGMAGRIGAAVGEEETAGVKVTLSFGVSSLRAEVREPGELINRADSALYIAKEGGRNRVVCWDDDEMRCLAAKAGRKAKAGDEPGNVPAAGEPPEARHYRETMLTVRLQAAETTPEKSRPAQKSKDCLLSV
jgi:diguanylate cyclase (GGDEF)-like protein